MEILPANDAQSRLLHNFMMVFITAGAWLLFALIGLKDPTWQVWIGLVMMLVMSHIFPALWFWDMYIRSHFFPDSELEDPDFFELAFQKWMSNQGKKEHNLIWRLQGRIEVLEKKLGEG